MVISHYCLQATERQQCKFYSKCDHKLATYNSDRDFQFWFISRALHELGVLEKAHKMWALRTRIENRGQFVSLP